MALYLIHRNIGVGVIETTSLPWIIVVPAVSLTMILVASLMHRYVEQPCQQLARSAVSRLKGGRR